MNKRFLLIASLLMSVTLSAQSFMDGWLFWSDTRPEKQVVNLPHDAMLQEPRRADAPSGSAGAFFMSGSYHYEKQLDVPKAWLAKHVSLHFDGAYKNARVFVNGAEAGGAVYGYIPFDVALDGLLKAGRNVIRVDVENMDQPDSRWYSGAGIYRPVKLLVQEKEHIDDVRIATVSLDPAVISIDVRHNGKKLLVDILDGDKVVASLGSSQGQLTIPEARLWSAESPYLYTARVRLMKGRKVLEEQRIPFGIRTLSWSPEGFFVNGENVLLKGGCIHADNGILGAAEYEGSAYRRIAMLKEYGFNAIRSAHNPASEAILKACDELGMYVMDELWDMWFFHKNKYDYATAFRENYLQDIASLVRRDYNHPSVVMYSIGNEVSEPVLEGGMDVAHSIIEELHRLDPSRPVTGGINLMILSRSASGTGIYDGNGGGGSSFQTEGMTSQAYNNLVAMVGASMSGKSLLRPQVDSVSTPILDALDIAGYNYGRGRYETEGTAHPGRIIVGSETMPYNIAKNWEMVKKLPYLVGDFMWTAWDYMGETGIGAWTYETDAMGFAKPYPWLLADTGALDILGNPNGEAFLAKATWEEKPGRPYICVRPIREGELIKASWRGTNSIPSWSWYGCEGKTAVVEVFTGADEVELFLNGVSIDRKKVKDKTASFELAYKPGILKAVAFKNGVVCGESQLESATGGVHLRTEMTEYGQLVYADISLVGDNGEVWNNRDKTLRVMVEGGQLLGFGSAAPRTESAFVTGTYPTWQGRAQAVIRKDQTTADPVKITVLDAEDVFSGQRTAWMEKANFSSPLLKYNSYAPHAVVHAVQDSSAFQGWRYEKDAVSPESLSWMDFSKQKTITLDFGEHRTGFVSFRIRTIKGDMDAPVRLKLFFGELPAELNTPLEPWRTGMSRAWMQDEMVTVTEPDTLITIPRRMAFRYLKIDLLGTSSTYSFAIDGLACKAGTSAKPFTPEYRASCPDRIRQIDEVGLRTLRECMQTVFEDGPKRDHRLWTGDLYLQNLANRYSYREFELTRHCLYLLAALSGNNGLVPADVFETPVPHAESGSYALSYCLLYNSTLLDYLEDTGDLETVSDLWPVAMRQTETIRKCVDKNGIYRHNPTLGWLFFDWREGLDVTIPMQGAIISALDETYKLAQALGKEKEVADYPRLAETMRQASLKRYYDETTGVFSYGRQTSVLSQVWMIKAGLLSPAAGAAVLEKVLSLPDSIKPGTPYATHYLIDAMLQCGMEEQARDYLEYYWGGMVEKGADTFWEAYDPNDDYLSPYGFFPVNSACHAWSCTPVYFIHRFPDLFQNSR